MMSYIVWDVSPVVFDGFAFLRWYSVGWLVGAVIGYWLMLWIYRWECVPVIELDKLTLYVMIGVVIGARLGHILFYDPAYYWNNPIEILPVKMNPTFEFTGLAGLASHGGVVGALVGLYFYNRKFRRGYLWLLDRLTIAACALGAFIRLGNLMNSEIIGTPSDLPWAFVFMRVDDIPRHPSQLYEAVFYLLMSVALYLIWKRGRFSRANGFLFGLGLALIFTQRFLVEFVKEAQVSFEQGLVLNMGQMLSIPLILLGVLVMVWSLRRPGYQIFHDGLTSTD